MAGSHDKLALEYILAMPEARYREFADDLKVLIGAQALDQSWCAETRLQGNRLVVAHDPVVAIRRAQARDKTIAQLVAMEQQCSDKLDGQDAGIRTKRRPMSDLCTKTRFYHTVKDAHMAHVITVGLMAELFNYMIDEEKKCYLELLDLKLLLVTNVNTPAAEVVQRRTIKRAGYGLRYGQRWGAVNRPGAIHLRLTTAN